MRLYRSLLFVPGHRADWMEKAPGYGADALVLDLEDAVPIAEKARARGTVREAIEKLSKRGVQIVVRVNGLNTGLTGEDVEAVVTPGLSAIIVPKLERPEEILKVDAWLEFFERRSGVVEGTVEIVALPETALGILNVYQLATACPRVGNVIGGLYARSGDIARAIGYSWTREGNETLFLASHIVASARAAGIKYPIASSAQEFTDEELARSKLRRAAALGFRGALAIHPSQVKLAHEIFGPELSAAE